MASDLSDDPKASDMNMDMDWDEMGQHFKLDPQFGDVERAVNEILDGQDVEDFEMKENYLPLLEQLLENPMRKRRAYVAVMYRDSQGITQEEASEIFGVDPITIKRTEQDLGLKDRYGIQNNNLDSNLVLGQYNDQEVDAAVDYITERPGFKIDEARKALEARRLGKAVGVEPSRALVDEERDSGLGDVQEIQEAVSYIDERIE